jgi:Family of unknown function (DUF6519)
MKGDFSRWSFQPQRHYHGVLKQQGRVDLEADWNEQGAILNHRVESEALDVVGPSGAPQGNAGFLVQPAAGGASLIISAGRAYVDGILCENDQTNLDITAQPDLPGFQRPNTAGMYVAYLEVWERHITYLDDSEILETALGGPDTCTRAKTVWQVKLQQAGALGSGVTCATDVPSYDALIAPSTGALQAQAQPTTTTDPCMVPATAGFRSLENQLYRVEIHNAGAGTAVAGSGTATFKWSRDNGSVVASWISPPSGQTAGPNTLFVGSITQDNVLGFAAGQWVELSDDSRELNFNPGTLVQLTNVQGQVLTVDPATVIPSGGSLNLADYKLNPKVRRWDSAGATPATTGAWLNLENGVQVQFAGGSYNIGDYWLIPARTLTAEIDWPLESGNPISEPPRGILRHYCKLAIVQFDGTAWSLVATCLPTFPPLTDLDEPGIHITDVRLLSPDQELLNDREVAFTAASKEFGINVLLDAPVDPVSAQPTTCFVTVDVPYPLKDVVASIIAGSFTASANLLEGGSIGDALAASRAVNLQNLPFLGYQPLILPGNVRANSSSTVNQIVWTVTGLVTQLLLGLLESMPALLPTSRLLTHLTLKGDFIWGLNNPTLYLDGNVFGVTQTDATGTHIGLRLPKSGDGKRGGDFEIWFWLVLPLQLVSMQFSPNPVTVAPGAGANSTGTLTLVGTQLTAGTLVTLTAKALDASGAQITANIGAVPPSITLSNISSPTFPVTGITLPPATPSAQLQVTATYGTQSVVGTLAITAQVVLTGLAFAAPSVIGGAAATLVVTLNVSAPSGGAAVALTSNATQLSPAAATVPATAVVPAGSSTFKVSVPTFQRANVFVLQVTGTFGGSAAITASLSINPPSLVTGGPTPTA